MTPPATAIAALVSVFVTAAVPAPVSPKGPANPPAVESPHARNIILLVGDGMGVSEMTLARYYFAGAGGRLAMDSLPVKGACSTWSVLEDQPSRPDYVPDSAATATAWATGQKTSNGRISTAAGTDRDLTTILELARQKGMRTGIVSTADLTDATPGALAAHVSDRSCGGPGNMKRCPQDRKEAGGPGSIAEQQIDHKVDVLLGGGRKRFEQATDAGPTVMAFASDYAVVKTADELASVKKGRVLGLFASGNMSLEWNGSQALPWPSNAASPQACRPEQRPAAEPSLAVMTGKAIELLDRREADTPGFFLQVEGASIDKQAHEANPCGQIGETIAFDRAVAVASDFARARGDTLVIVTADHSHAGQIVPLPSDAAHPAGLLSTLMTKDQVPLTVFYASTGDHKSQGHTGADVPILAEGPGAEEVSAVRDQTDLFGLMTRALGLTAAP